jgi:predicted nuclease of predicted toxin-antitoxin system
VQILADENVPEAVIEVLLKRGHDVIWALMAMPGAPDREIIARANGERRLLLTFDKDFGEFAFRDRLSPASGVIFIRLESSSPTETADVIAAALASPRDWIGYFSTVEKHRIRARPLPRRRP